jgi:hypothetical protein
MEDGTFRRLYAKNLLHGDRTQLAYRLRKSEEYISRLTRYGGEACPLEKGWKWLCAIYAVNPDCAIALLDSLNSNFAEMRQHSAGEWNPQTTAASLVKKAAEAVAALITDCTSDDEVALLELQRDVEMAIEQCRLRKGAPKLREAKR